MIYILLFLYIVVLSLITIVFCHIIHENKMKDDLAFFVLCNYILSFSFLIFFFYYFDYLFSLMIILLLLLNTIFLNFEIKGTYDKYKYLSLPYLIYIAFIFFLIFDLFLFNL